MVCGIIWAAGVALKGVAIMGYRELAIVTMKKTCKESKNRKKTKEN